MGVTETAGWELKSGVITEYNVSEDKIWSLFNYVFSDSCKKRNTYKFGLIKSVLDNLFNGKQRDGCVFYSYEKLFERFAANYWNLVVKYDLRQMRKDGRSQYSKVETIFFEELVSKPIIRAFEFEVVDEKTRKSIVSKVASECKKYVIGALYKDFDGIIYSFDLKEEGLLLNKCVYEFLLKYKSEIEKLNYYSWAKFLEEVNDESVLLRILDKLELATPRRNNLALYREILQELEDGDVCFYCGEKLKRRIHVDHFIPWSFVKDDKLWNFVLSCPRCNESKNNKVPRRDLVVRLEDRNTKMRCIENQLLKADFEEYSEGLIERMWNYAKLGGMKEYI